MSKNGYMYYGSLKSFQGKDFDTGIILKSIVIQKKYWKPTINIRILAGNKELLFLAPKIKFTTPYDWDGILPVYKIHLTESLSLHAAELAGKPKLKIEVSNIPPEKVMIRAKVL